MKNRPWSIIIIAFVHIIAGPINLILNKFRIESLHHIHEGLFSLPMDRLNIFVTFLGPVIAGVAIYLCKKWSLYLYLAIMGLIAVMSVVNYTIDPSPVTLMVLVTALVVDIAVVVFFLLPAVRSLYLDPRLRWWERDDRYRTEIETAWFENSDKKGTGTILNISQNGMFIKAGLTPPDGDLITIKFEYDGVAYEVLAHVILHSLQNIMGFGCKFDHSAGTRQAMKDLAHKLDRAGLLMNPKTRDPEDTLIQWLKRFVKTGKGLTPEKRG